MNVKNVAILGAGNGGCAAAADLTLRGFGVRLFNRTPERLQPIVERGGLDLQGVAGEGFARLHLITTDVAAATEGVDVLVLTLPTSALVDYAPLLAPVLKPGQVIFLNPGHMGGSLYFANALRRLRPGFDPRICEATTLTYACRMAGPAAVRIFNVATNLLFAALPARNTQALHQMLAPLFPSLVPAENVLQTGLQDLNAIEHPAQMVCNAGWVEHTKGDFYFYFEGTTPGVSSVIEAVDEERMNIAAAARVPTLSFVDYFARAGYTTREAAATGRVFDAMQASEANRWIKGPKSLQHRYLTEDVAWGLVPWINLARVFGVQTPTMEALTALASIMNGQDYMSTGLTLERMGLEGAGDAKTLLDIVTRGPESPKTAGR